jgi:hypothetical protein
MRAAIAMAVIFLCSALLIGWLFLSIRPGDRPLPAIATKSILAFVVSSGAVFLKPRFSYWLGIVSGIAGLYWFSRLEFFYFPALNSWVTFNLPADNPQFSSEIFTAKLKILLVGTVLIATALCVTRLLPGSWVIRKIPIRERTWPALAVCFLVVATWYSVSVSPYRIPLIVDGLDPELVLLHVMKQGIQFHETAVTAFRDGRVYARRNDRRLFQYRFESRVGSGLLSETVTARVRNFAQSIQLSEMRTAPAIALRNKDAEGWYVRTGRRVFAFTTENRTQPPREVVDLFHQLESLVQAEKEEHSLNDICMGFCYDPPAGLGLQNLNDRCAERNGTRCK